MHFNHPLEAMKTMFRSIQTGVIFLYSVLLCTSAPAAPGDLSVTVVSRTGDAGTGPGGAPVTEFDKTFFLGGGIAGQYPFSIDGSGKITFAASVVRDSEPLGGIYAAGATGTPQVIVEKGMTLPGVLVNGEGRAIDVSPWKAMSTSPSGRRRAFTVFSANLQQGFIYNSDGSVLSAAPLAWTENLSLTNQGNFNSAMSVSDGRGSTQNRFLGTLVTTMLVNDSGVVFWENGFGTVNEIFRAAAGSPTSAIVFADTPAPGFPPGDNATFKSRLNLIGVDTAGNAFFRADVLRGSSTSVAVYRHNASDNSLTLLLVGGETLLPDPSGSNTLTANVNLEDLFADLTGTVYFRGRIGSTHTGFWKVAPDGQISLMKSLSQFSPVPTDRGNITYRSVEAGDWGVAPGGTIYFSSDANLGAATRVEGIWRIDGTTFDVTTIARETDPAIPPTTATTFTGFSKLSASGNGSGSQAVFMATLSDGTEALYATDPSGAFVKITREGEALDGSAVTALHYTPDAAGEGLAINQGAPGINASGAIAFVAELANNTTALVRAEFGLPPFPSGVTYVWDGGAGDTNWHTVSEGRSNWVDSNGIPWDAPPKTDGTSVIMIGSGFLVRILDVEVVVKSILLTNSTLESSLNAETDDLDGDATSKLILFGGSFFAAALETTGSILKEGAGDAALQTGSITITNGTFTIKEGKLDVFCSDSEYIDTPITVESGTLNTEGPIRFRGTEAGVRAVSATAGAFFNSSELHFETDTTFEALHASSKIGFGGPLTLGSPTFHFDGTSGNEKRTVTLAGQGEQTLYAPVNIAENGILRCESEVFTIALTGTETMQIDGLLENYGTMTLSGGNYETGFEGSFINEGAIEIPGGLPYLDLDNRGSVNQSGDVGFGVLNNRGSSVYTLTNATLGTSSGLLRFEAGATLAVGGGGQSVVAFSPLETEDNFDPIILFTAGSELEVIRARMGRATAYEAAPIDVPAGSKLTLEDLQYKDVHVGGKGLTCVKGSITGVGIESTLGLGTFNVEATDAVFDGSSQGETTRVNFSSKPVNLDVPGEPQGTLNNVTVGQYARVDGSFREFKIENTLTLGGSLFLIFPFSLDANIRNPDFGPPTGLFHMGGSARMSILASLAIDVPFHIEHTFSPISLAPDAVVTFAPGTAFPFFNDGVITKGNWNLAISSSVNLVDSNGSNAIKGIGFGVRVTLKNQSSFGTMPSPTNNLIINGNLILDGTTLNMNTNTLINKGNVEFKNGGKIEGNVESIRDQVQGVFQLAGAVNIDGNLTTDGVLSLGASPGSGIVTGDLNLLPGSEIIVEFAGTTPGTEFDFLEVGGTATLDGTLTLELLDDYRPTPGTSFQFIQAGSVSGNFSTIDQSCLPRDLRFTVSPVATGLSATMGTLSTATYAQWRAAYFYGADLTDDLISGPTADPDGDGQSNLFEYATDGLPGTPDNNPLTIDSAKPAILSLRWANGVTDYTWQLQTSENLQNPWPPASHTSSLRSTGQTSSVFELLPDAPLNAAGTRFFRVEIIPSAP